MQYFRNKVFGTYFQDDWRIRKSLTLNLGLRYEMTTIPTEIHDHVYEMPSLTTKLNCGPTGWVPANICPVPPLGLTPGDPLAQLNRVVFTHNPTLKNFEPRVGFAWDPFHDGKTSVRGGFGIFDALPLPYELVFNATSTIPFNNPYLAVGPTGFVLSPNQQRHRQPCEPYPSSHSGHIPVRYRSDSRRFACIGADDRQGAELRRTRSEAQLHLSMELQHPASTHSEHDDPGGVCRLTRAA